MTPDIRAYLEIRTSGHAGFNYDGSKQLISSNLPGVSQVFRLDADRLDGAPISPSDLPQLTDHDEPVGAGYLPTDDRLLLVTDTGGNERHQLYLATDTPDEPMGVDDFEQLVVDPEHIHRPGGVTRDGSLLAYSANRRTGDDFDVWVRELPAAPGDGRSDDAPASPAARPDEELVYAPGGWTGPAGWSPSGRWLALSELTHRPGDNRVHLLDRRTGRRAELAPHDDGLEASVGGPSWLPDESAFYFSTSVGSECSRVWRCDDPASGAAEPVIDTGWDTGVAVDWTGRWLLVARNEDGRTRAELRDPRSLDPIVDVPLPGEGVAGGFRFTRDGSRLAFTWSSPLVPGDVWSVDLEDGFALSRVTTSPCDVDPATFVAPELIRYRSFDGLEVPAFVFRPDRAGAAGRTPVVVVVHGGPESQYRPTFAPLTQYLVARGFAVVAPNVRGSTGYGRTYEHLDDVDKRLDSVRDLAGLHDWIASTDDLDPDRAALYGGSYGGYMVLAGLAFQPDRWAAGVDIVGMSNLVTFLENTASWRRAFREREYGSLEHDRDLLLEVSPITHVDAMRAPLFIVHGRNDPRVPVGEAEQIHDVLTGRGIRSELLVYDDEGHGLAKLDNRVDAYPRVAAFLDEVLRP